MNSTYENGICETRFPPKTPGPRPPLPRMKKGLKPQEESDDKSPENRVSDDSDTDADFHEPPSPLPNISKNVQSNKSVSSQSSTSSKKTEEFVPTSKSNISKKLNASKNQQNGATIKWHFIIPILVCIISIAGWYITRFLSTNGVKNTSLPDKEIIENFEATLDDMSNRFKKQHSYIWNEIFAGVVDIIKHPEKRSIIILFSNHDDPMFCLAKMVGNATKAALRTDDNLWLIPSQLGDDYGSVIDRYRDEIKEKRIVIIENLLDVHPEAIRAFHNLCDSENPLVRQTFYILTMITQDYKNDERPIHFIEGQLLRKLKGKINPDKLQPLITRLTDAAIIPVQPEPDITSCPLRY